MKKILAFATAAALGLGVAACDGANEEAMEDAGEANVDAVEEQADAMEDADMITDTQEDAIVDAAEGEADAMEEQGEAIDEGAMAPAATATPAQ